jgi:hypothetical protein
VDLDADEPTRVLGISSQPVLDIGSPGAFDENGVVPTALVPVGDQLYLYYVGYQLGHRVRYFQFEGLAVSDNGGRHFTRHSRVPILDRSDKEHLNRTGAFVLRDEGVFKMWYVGGDTWIDVDSKALPKYNLRYVESPDGKTWPAEGHVCIHFQNEDEHALGRPWVLRDNGIYRLFYSVRSHSKGYRLGYAESKDGHCWERKDQQLGLNVSESGWDSEMICYSSVVRYKDRVYLFHCGNNCGETGFGCAVLESW